MPEADLDAHLLSSTVSASGAGVSAPSGGGGPCSPLPLTAGFALNASVRARLLRWYQLRLERYSEHSMVRAPGIARPGDQVRLVQTSSHQKHAGHGNGNGNPLDERQSASSSAAPSTSAPEAAAAPVNSSGEQATGASPVATATPSAHASATTAPAPPAAAPKESEDPAKYVVPHIAVKDLDHSWLDGLAFCTLLHLYHPSTYVLLFYLMLSLCISDKLTCC